MTKPYSLPAGRRSVDPLGAARLHRDAAIERSRSITKMIGAASVAAVAVLAMYVGRAFPGHSTTPPASTSTGSGGQAGGGPVSGTSGGSSDIAPPSAAPAPSSSQAPVVSGSS